MSDTFDEDDIFDEESQNILTTDNDSASMANEDVESVGSHSSTDSKTEGSQKSISKYQSPVSKALQRVFRSRSSSPRIANLTSKPSQKRKGSPNRLEDSPESTSTFCAAIVADNSSDVQKGESDYENTENTGYSIGDSSGSLLYDDSSTVPNYGSRILVKDTDAYSDTDDCEWFSLSERISLTPPPTLRKLSRNSLAQLHSVSSHDMTQFKPMVTSRSFSCLQSCLSKVSKGEIPNSLIQKASEEYFKSVKLQKKKFNNSICTKGISKSSNSIEVPKVFVSIDDDHPCSPEEENRFGSFFQDSSEFYESVIINEDDGLSHIGKQSEEELSDREITPRKVKSVLKTLSLWKMNRAGGQSPETSRITKQFSIDSEPLHNNCTDDSIHASLSSYIPDNFDKAATSDSRLKVLKKLTLSLQSKDKTKSQESNTKFLTEVCDEPSVKGLLNDINSSEESIPLSVLEKNSRKGKFRELGNFLIKENSSHPFRSRKGHEDTLDEAQFPSSYSVSEMSIKNSKSFGEKVAEYLQRGGSRLQEQQRRLKSQIWSSVVTIVLIEGKDLPAMDRAGSSDPYVKFRLGNEKYKSKVEFRSLNPRWLEQFDFHLFEDQSQLLEITVWDKDPRAKDEFIGRCTLDMRNYERENTHEIWVELEGESELHEGKCGKLFLLLTISGTTSTASISDLISHKENPNEIKATIDRYRASRTFHNLRDVGMLTVKIFKAQGLAAADFGVGKSDPFCVLELVNSRLQTQTEYKTLSPSWNKIFTFDVKDIHSVLEVTVYDEDRDHKVDFLGKVAIPLLKIKNGDKKWYALKDKKLRIRAKGNYPEILMECSVYWNPIRAAIQTFEPKEEKYMQLEPKFKRQIFVRNVNRIRASIMDIIDFGLYIKSCFEWESPFRSVVSFILFVVITYYFEVYMLPAFILLLFVKNYIVISIVGSKYHKDEDAESSANEDEIDEDDKDKEEKKSLKERLQAIQEVIATVQNVIGYIASFGESVKNTFNFTVPLLSWLMVLVLLAIMIVLYMIPVRFLVLLWGINKFSRKLIRPHSVVNNEITDFLSRVPDDEQLKDYREIKTSSQSQDERRKECKKKKASS